jgi:hypothetical protein
MRISAAYQMCVQFVGYIATAGSDLRFGGTAFGYDLLIDYDEKGNENKRRYLVTAKHVIIECRDRGYEGKIRVRINTSDGKSSIVITSPSDWQISRYSKELIDVAALAVDQKQFTPEMQIDYLHSGMAVNNTMIGMLGIGEGDDTFVVGLFVNHAGKQRNLPIVRIGNIAAMPSEMITTPHYDIHAYLLEVRSVGGLSGSPVFLITDRASWPETILGQPAVSGKITLLGLIHGHWSVPKSGKMTDTEIHEEDVNQGIAMVVPAPYIEWLLKSTTTEYLDPKG